MPVERIILANHSGHAGFGAINANDPITINQNASLLNSAALNTLYPD